MALKVDRRASGQIYRVYESSTGETVQVFAPVSFYDDFCRYEPLLSETGSEGVWLNVDVGGATQALLANTTGGKFRLALDATDEAQDAVLYFGDEKPFDVGNQLVFETRLTLTSASMTGIRLVAGMAGDHNLAKDSVTEHAWFSMDGSLLLNSESDDTTNDNDDKSTGTTWVTTESHVLRIDFNSDLTDVMFYLDGSRVTSGTTFDMSNLTAAEQQMQPYFSLDKASGTTLCQMDIDYVRVFSLRT